VANFEWDLGDGTRVTLNDFASITHQYKTEGKYTIKLKAIDAGTCVGKDSTSTVVEVYKALGMAGNDGTMCYGGAFSLSASARDNLSMGGYR
jgi:PKD repeat protein